MNYGKMSDLEINAAVAKALGWNVLEREAVSSTVFVITKYGRSVYRLPNYCNSWGDMGPIIEQNEISLIFDKGEVSHQAIIGFSSNFGGEGGGYFTEFECEHKNILRAAAIVFLMSQESK